ncbi:hypothetical protein EZV62_014644 [Acer yangbiense]|uniref:Myb/SANT-like domain-containing protein n=1 Tax=Acer yangbiense TaxID=1000413 RepID=A0A5C7HSR4_9ROSI|nr:hypothetical protein EZV62_014644 [Acer yangbiense]
MVIFFESYETRRRRLFRNSSSSILLFDQVLDSVFDCEIHEINGDGTRLQTSYKKSQLWCSVLLALCLVVFALGPVFAHLVSISTGSNFKSTVEQGHRPGTHFTKVGWDNLVKNFNKTTGKEYNKVQLKNRWDTLTNDWKLWRDLVGKETGLWNAKLKTIDASEEWWHRKLQVHHNAAKFRKEGIEPVMMDKLDRMFMNITATRDHAWAPSSGVLPSDSSNTDTILLEMDEETCST